ncbi:short-chain dehydrogenase reductase 4-like [Cornus florida]|uniref:short-chain dehydrogenase reductase 4-like n=1 Tax=Cornus florida TaxID=4283 RepID=UPI0028967C15|nr:short-chain dehydrogenase reductase 4-like [Cornus florida]
MCSNKLDGELAIITDGISGISKETTQLFANHGTRAVVISNIQDKLVQSASQQLGEHGIRVNSVSPFAVAIPLLCEMHEKNVEEVEKIYEPFMSLKGIVLKVKHVVDVLLFLGSDDSPKVVKIRILSKIVLDSVESES